MDNSLQNLPTPQREAHLRDYWKVLWQGRWTLLAVFVVVLGATALWTFLQTPVYEATATLEIQPKTRSVMSTRDVSGMGSAGFSWVAAEKYQNTQIEIIRSRDVASRVVDTLDLTSHPSFAEATDPVDALRRRVRVVPRRDTELLEVSIAGADPNEVTQLVNAISHAYVDRNYEKAKHNIEQSVAAVSQQLDGLNEGLERAEKDRITVLERTRIYDRENQETILREKLKMFNDKLIDARIEAKALESLLGQVASIRGEGGDLLSLPDFSEDAQLKELISTRTKTEQELEKAKVRLRTEHPQYDELRRQLRDIDRKVEQRVNLIVSGLERQVSEAQTREALLETEKANTERESIAIARASADYDGVAIRRDTMRQIRDSLLTTMQEIQLSAELLNNNVDIIDEAQTPRFPVKPRRRLNLVIGSMLGLFLGCAAVFFLDYLDNTIRTPEDIEKFLGLSVLGVVPKMGDEGVAKRAVREAYNSLRTSIIFSSKNRQHRVILITSTGPREGKSSTIANLGRTLAAAGDRVVILDCDLRKPRQHEHHGLQREPGLTNYLAAPADDHDWGRFLQRSDNNLDLLTCGPIPPSPPELLGSERFIELLRSLRERYDWVLIDSPPAANLADPSLLASMAEMVVMVVRHNSTDRDHVVKTYQQLRTVSANVVGVVLNNVDLGRTYHKDYYYAGYYYQEEETEGGRKSKRLERKVQAG